MSELDTCWWCLGRIGMLPSGIRYCLHCDTGCRVKGCAKCGRITRMKNPRMGWG